MKALLKAFIPLLFLMQVQENTSNKKSVTNQKGEIEIRISDTNSKKTRCNNNYDSTFSVIIKNNTDSIASFYEDWNMWGYYNLYFKINLKEDTIYFTKKQKEGWDKNFPSYYALNPGDSMIIDYTKDCSCKWSEFRCLPAGNYESVKIKAIYELQKGLHELQNFLPHLCINRSDNRTTTEIYKSFPSSKIESKEFSVEIRNGTIQNIK